jgi:hypothetical protein
VLEELPVRDAVDPDVGRVADLMMGVQSRSWLVEISEHRGVAENGSSVHPCDVYGGSGTTFKLKIA